MKRLKAVLGGVPGNARGFYGIGVGGDAVQNNY